VLPATWIWRMFIYEALSEWFFNFWLLTNMIIINFPNKKKYPPVFHLHIKQWTYFNFIFLKWGFHYQKSISNSLVHTHNFESNVVIFN
jgi:hypothetical protein